MKHAYAAAAILAGWYLMTPPLGPDGRYDSTAPLSEWRIESGFNTGEACRKTLPEVVSRVRKEGNGDDIEKVKDARCVADDDSRLKEQ
jgi:hypothetical protein